MQHATTSPHLTRKRHRHLHPTMDHAASAIYSSGVNFVNMFCTDTKRNVITSEDVLFFERNGSYESLAPKFSHGNFLNRRETKSIGNISGCKHCNKMKSAIRGCVSVIYFNKIYALFLILIATANAKKVYPSRTKPHHLRSVVQPDVFHKDFVPANDPISDPPGIFSIDRLDDNSHEHSYDKSQSLDSRGSIQETVQKVLIRPYPTPKFKSLHANFLKRRHKTEAGLPPMKNTELEADPFVIVYYYDPQNIADDKFPTIIYDENGNAILISALVKAGVGFEFEAPKFGTSPGEEPPIDPKHPPPPPKPISNTENTEDIGETTDQTQNLNYHPIPTEQKRRINPHDWEHIAPEAQDQMIIVSTVATMALLVGALSARRLRSRQFLSSCIENESLEDELAYDTAYTTGVNADGAGSYDTFAGVPWKGDLEKFDV